MNRTLGIVFLFLLTGCKKEGPTPLHDTEGTIVTRSFGGSQDDIAMDVQVLDQRIYLLGNTQSYGAGQTDILLTCYTLWGEQLWYKTYGGSLQDEAIHLHVTSDKGLIITGSSDNGTTRDGYIIKVDTDGNILWDRTLDKGFDEELSGCVEDNGFLYFNGNQTQGTNADMWLLKTDLTGNEVWSKNYGGTFDDKGRHVIKAVNGNLLSWAMTYNYGQGDREVWLFEFNQNGDSVTSTTIGTPAYEQPGNMLVTNDGNYLCSYHTAGSDPTHDLAAHLLDPLYQDVWKIDTGTVAHEGGEDVCETPSSYIAFGNQGNFGSSLSDIYLLFTDKNGTPQKTQTLSMPGEQWLKAASYQNGWLYMAVSDNQGSNYDLMLVMMKI